MKAWEENKRERKRELQYRERDREAVNVFCFGLPGEETLYAWVAKEFSQIYNEDLDGMNIWHKIKDKWILMWGCLQDEL